MTNVFLCRYLRCGSTLCTGRDIINYRYLITIYNPLEDEFQILVLLDYWQVVVIEYIGPMRILTTRYLLPYIHESKAINNNALQI